LIVVEALLGASLVLFGWVATDTSPARPWVVSVHLTNTFFLVAAVTLSAAWSAWPEAAARAPWRRGVARLLALGAAATLVVGVTGALSALGDTLYPSASSVGGTQPEGFASGSLLLGLRVVHPLVAIAGGLLLVVAAVLVKRAHPTPSVGRAAARLVAVVFLQLLLGMADAALATPVTVQVAHLMLASTCWIALVLLAVSAGAPTPSRERA
jgi:cytochrome c oxidase assembly protein subunit 15